jgi:hypothetical protein
LILTLRPRSRRLCRLRSLGRFCDHPDPGRAALRAGEGSQNPSLTGSGGGYSGFAPCVGGGRKKGQIMTNA